MDSLMIGGLGVGAILVLLALRVPIAFSLGSVSFLGIMFLRNERAALGILGSLPHDFAASWELSAVPMFLLMGAAAYQTGLTSSLYTAARLWLNELPGGLAVATNFTAAGFAAASGSSVATSAAVGRLAIPEMLKFGYDKALATGTVAASGTLGALIPPSIAFVIYGWFTEQSVGSLLIAGIIPGLMTAGLYTVMIVGRCMVTPSLAPRVAIKVTMGEKLAALGKVWPMPLLVLGVVGAIYSGLATPTEAGALGATLAFLIGGLQGRLTKKVIADSVGDAMRTTSSLFFLAIGAVMLTRFLALAGVPTFIADTVAALQLGPVALVMALAVIYLILGMFLDPIGVMLLTLPVFLPAFHALDMDLIWIGVIVVKMIEVGLLTPPVGLNVYVVKGVAGDSVGLATVFKGVAWFLACELVIMILLISFPALSTWLPSLMAH
ncbi:TRAP transporter large permease subunit [Albimonas sp. CAU 1670]|uniref:TRAP transporter large permease n=1 Tax=Albimonas sp. CAU 1670 TaxID=3032599 RepID=UPI0023DA2736|nr:TRAP transporter large permease subunit [Albimonas sp. CAU 1670]MDF2234999.1 TRAP transporter large permease subunit [Albimonas sp. CAU 1670]